MSRSYEERLSAWRAWVAAWTVDGWAPAAFEHHCGALTPIMEFDDLGCMVCSGCGYELARPEDECTPLYRLWKKIEETVSPLRNPIGDVFEELAAKLHSIGYHMTTPTSRVAAGPERWSLEILRSEEPLELNWAHPGFSPEMEVALQGVKLTRDQARSLRAHLDGMLDEDPPPTRRKPDLGPGVGEWLRPERKITELTDWSAFLVAFEWTRLREAMDSSLREAWECGGEIEMDEIEQRLRFNLDLCRWRKVPTDG